MHLSIKKRTKCTRKGFSRKKKLNMHKHMSNSEFIIYICPFGWKMINVYHKQDLHQYFIIDENNTKRIGILGNWRAVYHREFGLTILESEKIELLDKTNTTQVNVTNINLMGEFVKPCAIKINNICT